MNAYCCVLCVCVCVFSIEFSEAIFTYVVLPDMNTVMCMLIVMILSNIYQSDDKGNIVVGDIR